MKNNTQNKQSEQNQTTLNRSLDELKHERSTLEGKIKTAYRTFGDYLYEKNLLGDISSKNVSRFTDELNTASQKIEHDIDLRDKIEKKLEEITNAEKEKKEAVSECGKLEKKLEGIYLEAGSNVLEAVRKGKLDEHVFMPHINKLLELDESVENMELDIEQIASIPSQKNVLSKIADAGKIALLNTKKAFVKGQYNKAYREFGALLVEQNLANAIEDEKLVPSLSKLKDYSEKRAYLDKRISEKESRKKLLTAELRELHNDKKHTTLLKELNDEIFNTMKKRDALLESVGEAVYNEKLLSDTTGVKKTYKSIVELEKQLEKNDSEMAKLQSEISVMVLDSEIMKNNETIKDLGSQIKSLKEKVTALKNENSNKKNAIESFKNQQKPLEKKQNATNGGTPAGKKNTSSGSE